MSRPGVEKIYLLYYIADLGRLPLVKRQGYAKNHELLYSGYTFFMLRPLCKSEFSGLKIFECQEYLNTHLPVFLLLIFISSNPTIPSICLDMIIYQDLATRVKNGIDSAIKTSGNGPTYAVNVMVQTKDISIRRPLARHLAVFMKLYRKRPLSLFIDFKHSKQSDFTYQY